MTTLPVLKQDHNPTAEKKLIHVDCTSDQERHGQNDYHTYSNIYRSVVALNRPGQNPVEKKNPENGRRKLSMGEKNSKQIVWVLKETKYSANTANDMSK